MAHSTGAFGLFQRYSSLSVYMVNLELPSDDLGLLGSYVDQEHDTITDTYNYRCYLCKASPFTFALRLWKVMQVVESYIIINLGRDLEESVRNLTLLSSSISSQVEFSSFCLAFDFINCIAMEKRVYFDELAKVRKTVTEKASILLPRNM